MIAIWTLEFGEILGSKMVTFIELNIEWELKLGRNRSDDQGRWS